MVGGASGHSGVGGRCRRVTVTLARPTRSSASLKRSDGRRGDGGKSGPGREGRETTTSLPGHDNIPMATATRRAPNTKQSIVNVGDSLASSRDRRRRC